MIISWQLVRNKANTNIPAGVTQHIFPATSVGAVAQLGERNNGIVEVVGSIPSSSTKNFKGFVEIQGPFLCAQKIPTNRGFFLRLIVVRSGKNFFGLQQISPGILYINDGGYF